MDEGPQARLLAGRRIFVVEDDFLIGAALTDVLEAAGMTVLGPIGRLSRASAFLEQLDPLPDAALLDVDLHGERSYRLADMLTARGVPFVFTTGFNTIAMESRYGNQKRLEKPLQPAALLAILVALLDPPPDALTGRSDPRPGA